MAKKITKIKKNKNKENNKKYPVRIIYDDGSHILIPDSHQFGSFCTKHGCSMAATSIALQFLGMLNRKTVQHGIRLSYIGMLKNILADSMEVSSVYLDVKF